MPDLTREDILAAADRLQELAAAVPTTSPDYPGMGEQWKRGNFGDFGPTVHLGESTVETKDSPGGYALAAYLEAVHPKVVMALAVMLRESADTPTTAVQAVARAVPPRPA